MRRGAVLVAAAVATALAPAPSTAARPLETVTFVLRRSVHGPASFELQASVANDGRGSFVGAVGARAERGRITSATTLWAGSARRWDDATLNVDGTRWSACEVGACHDHDAEGWHGLGSSSSDNAGDDAMTHVFVTLVGKDVKYEFRGKGWTLVKTRLAFRYLDGSETSPLYVHAAERGVEAYSDGTLPGGRNGSLAVAIPPCSISSSGVAPRGAGTVTLDGGVRSESFTCPTSRILPSSYATRATTWRLHGNVVGDTTGMDTRLFVVDLPARLP